MVKEPRYVRTTNDINDDTPIRIVKGDPSINKVISVRDLFNDVDVNNLINYTINGNLNISRNTASNSLIKIGGKGDEYLMANGAVITGDAQTYYDNRYVNITGDTINIIIGTNVTLPPNTTDSMNIGGVLFGTGLNNTTDEPPLIGSISDGRIGVGSQVPKSKLDVNGCIKIGNDADSPSADKVDTLKYEETSNSSKVFMYMKTGAASADYTWTEIKSFSW